MHARHAPVAGRRRIVTSHVPRARANVGRELRGLPTCQNFQMKGRRSAALLCVLLAHVLAIYALLDLQPGDVRASLEDAFTSEPITLELQSEEEPSQPLPASGEPRTSRRAPQPAKALAPSGTGEAAAPAPSAAPSGYV